MSKKIVVDAKHVNKLKKKYPLSHKIIDESIERWGETFNKDLLNERFEDKEYMYEYNKGKVFLPEIKDFLHFKILIGEEYVDYNDSLKIPKKKRKPMRRKEAEKIALEMVAELNPKIITEDDLKILKAPNLLEIIDKEFNKKIVGEHEARKTIFMVANMRNVSNLGKATDNLMLNASSGVGKDHVSEAVFDFIPLDEKEELIRTTPKVLAYTRNQNIDPTTTWKKVTLRMEDVSNTVLNDDCFKVMSSAHPNKINTAKTVHKGKVIDTIIEGKPSIIITIASANPKEEMLRRYPIVNLDEGIDQTKEILKRQGKFAVKGKTFDYNEEIINALKHLKRVDVRIPFAEKLVKIFCPDNSIVRTHFPRFLDYIKSSCSLHQYQRKQEEGFYIAEKQDYDIAKLSKLIKAMKKK